MKYSNIQNLVISGFYFVKHPILLFFLLIAVCAMANSPNIVLVLTDDQGFGDLSCNGNPDLETPNIDAFAESAVVFNQFLASPVCSPTRASIMTGRYNYRTQAIDTFKGRSVMNPKEVTLAEILKTHGYTNGIFGKWHLGDNYPTRPQDQGFDEVLVHLGGGIGQPSDPIDGDRYFDPVLQHNGVETKFSGYCMDVYTDHALQFMEENQSQPFFVYLATNTPHAPWDDVPQKYLDKYAEKNITGKLGVYYGMISNIDDNFQRVLNKLDELHLTDDTIVIYMSDNGQASVGAKQYTAGLRGKKGTVYENGLRVPFYMRWPNGISSSKTVETMAAHIDILPTLLTAASLEMPDSIIFDGRNLMPLIIEDNPEWPDRYIAFQAHRGNTPVRFQNSAIRSQNWKLINNTVFGPIDHFTPDYQLYNLADDPGELHNCADQHPQRVRQMRDAYESWFEDVTREGYDLARAILGTAQQKSTTFTKQDLWIPREKPETRGYYRATVLTDGSYDITLQFDDKSPSTTTIRFQTHDVDLHDNLPVGETQFTFRDVILKAGDHNLQAWKIDGGEQLTRRLIVEKVDR